MRLLIFLYALCVAFVKSLSTDFPSVDDAIEFSRLSGISYEIAPSAISDCSEIADAHPNLLYDDLQCLLFKPESNVLVVYQKYTTMLELLIAKQSIQRIGLLMYMLDW